jgi:hypothetical protein
MERFEGTVRLAGDTVALRAILLVADQRLKVATAEHEIGDWELTEITARLLPDGCRMQVEGEELIVAVADPLRFAEAIGPRVTNPGNGALRNTGALTDDSPEKPSDVRRWLMDHARRVPGPARVMAVTGAGVIALAVWVPLLLITLVLLLALTGLLVGSFALMDPFLAVRLPDPLTPALLVRGGALGVGVALVLAVAL